MSDPQNLQISEATEHDDVVNKNVRIEDASTFKYGLPSFADGPCKERFRRYYIKL